MTFDPLQWFLIIPWYVWAIFALGVMAILFRQLTRESVKTMEIRAEPKQKSNAPTAEDYLEDVGDEAQPGETEQQYVQRQKEKERQTKPESIPETSGDVTKDFSEALQQRMAKAVLGAKLTLRVDAPVKVKDGKVFVDVPDGEIGTIVIESQEETEVAS